VERAAGNSSAALSLDPELDRLDRLARLVLAAVPGGDIALQVRYSRPRLLELAAGRTVVLTGQPSPKRWPPPPGRPDGAFERLGLNAQALAGLREGAYQWRAELDAAYDEAWQERTAAGEAEAWERRSSTMVSGE
jgi:hypothetical protein